MSPRRINQASVGLLLLGFGSALVIYLRAGPAATDPFGNRLMSKKYLHDLRLMGGKTNVVLAEFQAWLAERWEGENLAVTLAVLTVVFVLIFRFVAARPDLFNPDSPSPSAPAKASDDSGPPTPPKT